MLPSLLVNKMNVLLKRENMENFKLIRVKPKLKDLLTFEKFILANKLIFAKYKNLYLQISTQKKLIYLLE